MATSKAVLRTLYDWLRLWRTFKSTLDVVCIEWKTVVIMSMAQQTELNLIEHISPCPLNIKVVTHMI